MITIGERPLTPEEQEVLRACLLPSFCPAARDRAMRWMPPDPWSLVQVLSLIGALVLGLIIALLAGWRWGTAVAGLILVALVVLPSVIGRILSVGKIKTGLERLQHAVESTLATVVRCSAPMVMGFEYPGAGTRVWVFHGRGRQMFLFHGAMFSETDSFPNSDFEVALTRGRLCWEVLSLKCFGEKLPPSMWADRRGLSFLNLPAEPHLVFEGSPGTIPEDLATALADPDTAAETYSLVFDFLPSEQAEKVFGPRPDSPDVRGVLDFTVQPSFEPQTVLRIVYREDSAELQAARITSAYEVFRGPLTPDSLRERARNVTVMEKASRTVAFREMPEPLRRAQDVQEYAEVAVSCWTDTLDGTGYWHRAMTPSYEASASWRNPSRRQHRPQRVLISAYKECIRMTGLSFPNAR